MPKRTIWEIRRRITALGIKDQASDLEQLAHSSTELVGRYEGPGRLWWSEEEDAILMQALPRSMKYSEIRKHHLPNRTIGGIRHRVAKLSGNKQAPDLDQLAHSSSKPSFTRWSKRDDEMLIEARMSKRYRSVEQLQKALFLQKSSGALKKHLFDLEQSRPDLRQRSVGVAFYWTPERCARLIQVRRSQEKKTWAQICEEHFPDSAEKSLLGKALPA